MFSFGFNSFWNSMHGSRAVQELLNKPDLQLDELLEEDGLLSELKTLNQRLMSFLLKEENFKKLTSYVITEPDPEEAEVNRKKGYKFPFVCADVLSSDSQAIVSEFFKSQKDLNEDTAIHKAEEIEDDDEVNTDSPGLEKEGSTETSALTADKSVQEGDKSNNADANCLPYIDYLFTFLDSNEMNLTSAGYFAKIANNLFAKKPSELIAYLYEQRPVLLKKMANHISSKSIAEFLAKILTFESSILSSTEDEIYNTKRKDILKILIKKLDPKQELEEINNTAYLICEVLGKYNTMHCSQEILQHLLDKSTIDYFFELLKTKDSTVCCAVGLILGNIFAYYILINTPKMQYSNEDLPEGEAPAQNGAPQQLQLTEEIPLIAVFIENLGSIIEYIVNTSGKAFPSQYGAEVTPFGSARLKLVELIIIAMKANNQTIYSKLIEYGFLDGLLQLFARYEWNNMLHNQVEKIVTSIIDSDYHDLKASLFERTKILDFIINTAEIMEYTMGGKHERKIRKGYIGQLTRIANRIAENKDPEILKYTEAHEGWKDFVETQLSEINQKNNINLGGKDPRGRNEEEEIDSHNQFSGMMQQFSHYFANKNQGQNDDDDDDDNDNEHDNDNDDQDNDNENDDQDNDDQNNEEDYSQTIKYIHHGGEDDEEEENQTTEAKSLFTNDESHHVARDEKEGKSTGNEEEEEEDDDKGKQVEQQSLNNYNIQNDQSKYDALRNVKIEEFVLDPEYNSNTYWKRDSWHSAEDILAELEGK